MRSAHMARVFGGGRMKVAALFRRFKSGASSPLVRRYLRGLSHQGEQQWAQAEGRHSGGWPGREFQ